MADTTSAKPTDTTNWKLRRFVAYSILAHLGGGVTWGVPAWMSYAAEHNRVREEKELAEHFRKEETKAKEHVRQQRIEQTRKDVDKEMRKEFDKLTASLSDPKKDALWKDVAEKTTPESTHLAEALGNPNTPEQDLSTLEAELRRAMIDALNEELNAESARDLADRFVDQVESQVAPDLAQKMKDELAKQVAQKMREEAEKLIAKQREEAQKARDQALKSLREAAAKADAANAAAKQAGEQLAKANESSKKADEQLAKADPEAKKAGEKAKTEANAENSAAAKQMDQAAARLGEADAKVEQAAPKAANLDGKAHDQVAAANAAIDAATAAVAKASAAVQTKSADAGEAVKAAEQATVAAQAATKSAIDAVSSQEDRAALASAAIRAAAETELSAQVEKALTEELTKTTLPRLSGKLQEAFKKQLDANGLGDDALVAQVGREVQERLAKSVPEMAKAGDQAVDAKMGDVGSAAQGAVAPTLGDSLLDKALAEGLSGMGANAVKRVGDLAANESGDAGLVGKALKGIGAKSGEGEGEGDAAAMAALRDSVGALARSMGNGRLGPGMGSGGGSGSGISGLRSSALGRSTAGSRRNEALYAEITGQIKDRGTITGGQWEREGAQGEASQAEAVVGDVAARVVGEPATDTKPELSNDQPFTPNFKSIAFTTVPYFNSTFRIDGNLAKWDAMPAIMLKPEYGTDPSPQVMKLAWSNNGLFMYCKVIDPDHHLDKAEPNDFWAADVLEVWVDAYNTKEKFRARHLGQQFWVWPVGSASDPTMTGGESIMAVKGGQYNFMGLHGDKLERWGAETADGWVLEVRFPPELINDADLSAGRILGFNAYVTTNRGTKVPTNWYWSSGKEAATYAQPDTWGDILLAGSDAKIEVLSGHEDSAKRVLGVGEPLRLRVTDGDMDLNARGRDKVMVTLKDGHGGQQIAVLEETGESTGTFDGAVSTALALDEAVPAVLGVYEGERVEITYIDQARANGARQAQITTNVSFGAAIMAMSASTKAPAP